MPFFTVIINKASFKVEFAWTLLCGSPKEGAFWGKILKRRENTDIFVLVRFNYKCAQGGKRML